MAKKKNKITNYKKFIIFIAIISYLLGLCTPIIGNILADWLMKVAYVGKYYPW